MQFSTFLLALASGLLVAATPLEAQVWERDSLVARQGAWDYKIVRIAVSYLLIIYIFIA